MEDLIKIEEACRQARLALGNADKAYFFYGSAGRNFNNRVLSQNTLFHNATTFKICVP